MHTSEALSWQEFSSALHVDAFAQDHALEAHLARAQQAPAVLGIAAEILAERAVIYGPGCARNWLGRFVPVLAQALADLGGPMRRPIPHAVGILALSSTARACGLQLPLAAIDAESPWVRALAELAPLMSSRERSTVSALAVASGQFGVARALAHGVTTDPTRALVCTLADAVEQRRSLLEVLPTWHAFLAGVPARLATGELGSVQLLALARSVHATLGRHWLGDVARVVNHELSAPPPAWAR